MSTPGRHRQVRHRGIAFPRALVRGTRQQDRGVRLELFNAPADAFVDGEMIASTREMLFSALRDIVYTESELSSANDGQVSPDKLRGKTAFANATHPSVAA